MKPFAVLVKNEDGEYFQRGSVVFSQGKKEFVFCTSFFTKHIKSFEKDFKWIAVDHELIDKLVEAGTTWFMFYNKDSGILYETTGKEIQGNCQTRSMNKRKQYLLPIACKYEFFTKRKVPYTGAMYAATKVRLEDIKNIKETGEALKIAEDSVREFCANPLIFSYPQIIRFS